MTHFPLLQIISSICFNLDLVGSPKNRTNVHQSKTLIPELFTKHNQLLSVLAVPLWSHHRDLTSNLSLCILFSHTNFATSINLLLLAVAISAEVNQNIHYVSSVYVQTSDSGPLTLSSYLYLCRMASTC